MSLNSHAPARPRATGEERKQEVKERRISELVAGLPTSWLENYVAAFEAGRVQKHPQACFVNARGECCLVGALAGARSAADLVGSPVWVRFLGTELEALSRRFETCRLTGQDFYEEVLLALAERRAAAAVEVVAHGA